MLIVSSVEATELSFLLFFLSAGLVFDQAVAGFVVFHFHGHEKKVDLTIDRNANVAQKLFENGKCAKIEQMLCYPSADGPSFLRSICEQSLFMKQGILQLPFSRLIFSAQRGHFKKQ